MSRWPATKAKRVLAALLRIGWAIKRRRGSHLVLSRPGWPDFIFAFHDQEEIGPRMLVRMLTVITVAPSEFGTICEDVGLALETENVPSLAPIFEGNRTVSSRPICVPFSENAGYAHGSGKSTGRR